MQENEQPRTSSNELDGASAYVLANRLITIPRFPRDPVAVEHIADWLMETCQGVEIDNDVWTAHDQAAWLVQTAVNEIPNWDEAQGLPALRSMFNRRFKPPPAQREYASLGEAPPIDCKLCNDAGTVEVRERIRWCVCDQATLLLRDAPRLVEILDRALQRRLEKERQAQAAIERREQAAIERQAATPPVKSPESPARAGLAQYCEADIRAEIQRHARERNQHAKTQQLWTGPLSFLRRQRLYRMLSDGASRILRARTSG